MGGGNTDKITIMKIINFQHLIFLLSNLENYFTSDIREWDPGGEFQKCSFTSLSETSVRDIEADSSPRKGKSKERPKCVNYKIDAIFVLYSSDSWGMRF